MKVLAKEIAIGDKINCTTERLDGINNIVKNITGVITNITDYARGTSKYKYIHIMETGQKYVTGYYLRVEQELIAEALSEEQRVENIRKYSLRYLPRVVDQQGSDPEIFVVDKNNTVIPSFRFLGDKKTGANPFWDGYQGEFNIAAQSCLDGSVLQIQDQLNKLLREARKYDKDAKLSIIPTMDIPPHMLKEDDDKYVQFGCMPSKNVYGMKGKVADGRDVPFRSAGGHIHLELTEKQKKSIPEYVKALDAILGVACVSLFGKYDDVRRREYYGLAGEYRTPSHGLEYRPLSNVWLSHPTTMYIVFEMARKVISLVDKGLFHLWKYDENDVITAINDCNIPLACEIMKSNEEVFKDFLASFCYQDDEIVKVVYATFMLGIEELISNPEDIEKNWAGATANGRISALRTVQAANFKKLLGVKF